MGEGRFLCSVGLGIEGEVVDYYFIVGYRQSLSVVNAVSFTEGFFLQPIDLAHQ